MSNSIKTSKKLSGEKPQGFFKRRIPVWGASSIAVFGLLAGVGIGGSGTEGMVSSTDHLAVVTELDESVEELREIAEKQAKSEKDLQDARKKTETAESKLKSQESGLKKEQEARKKAEKELELVQERLKESEANLAEAQAVASEVEQNVGLQFAAVEPEESQNYQPVPFVADPAPSAYYKNCTAAREAGVTPIYSGDPGYGRHLDRDGDGIACE